MENGVTTFPTHDAMRPGDLARLVEERGHRYLFFSEHTHIPASRISPFPGGEPLERKYWNTYDVFVALTAAAMATTSLRVGSGICLIAQRDPIVTAKEIASIDHMSGGRVKVTSAPVEPRGDGEPTAPIRGRGSRAWRSRSRR